MNTLTYRCGAVAIGTCVLVAASTLIAHPDDPKELDYQPPYDGPGFRASQPTALGQNFPSDGVTLMSWLTVGDMGGGGAANDCWGYVSDSGREYAIVGLQNGTAFVEVTDPGNAQIVDHISGPSSTWRDIKTFQDYAYAVSEGGDGIQVIDLGNIDSGSVSLVNTVTTGGTSATHNIAINEDSGYLYRCGGGDNGIRIYNLNNNPAAPQFVSQYTDRYTHDAQIVTYTSGPYMGQEIAFLCGGFNGGGGQTGLTILDVTNKSNLVELAHLQYANGSYSHQGWLTEDRQYFLLNDELDESNQGVPTSTRVINVANLSAPFVADVYTNNGNSAIDHNLYIHGDTAYLANYRSGLRVVDVSDPLNAVETAYFDTYPDNDSPQFNGAWSVYPFFPSGTVIVSDIGNGLFVFRIEEEQLAFSYPNGQPDLINPGGDTVDVVIDELVPGAILSGTETLHFNDGNGWASTSLSSVAGDLYEATFGTTECGSPVEWYVSVDTAAGFTVTDPVGAPTSTYDAFSAIDIVVEFEDNLGSNAGWTTENVDMLDGEWEANPEVPAGAGDRGDPTTDFDGNGMCYLTDNAAGNTDVDGGPTRLISPVYDLTSYTDPSMSYARWFTNDDNDADRLDVEISNNGGSTWTLVESAGNASGWVEVQFRVADYVTPTANVRLRFSATDNPNDSVTEAGVDTIRIINVVCDTKEPPCDITGDGVTDVSDMLQLLAEWGPCPGCVSDVTGDGIVNVSDLLQVLADWGPCP